MKIFELILWGLAGGGIAFLFLKMQGWSVMQITADKPERSRFLIVGGAIFRWLLIGALFIMALSFSTGAALASLIGFITVRMLFLFFWQDALLPKQLKPDLEKK